MTSNVVELRQYTMVPGKRDALIELFDRALTAGQEAVGMEILGLYHDLDRPDRLVWMRGFRDLAARAEQLKAFYQGPVWKAHRDEANATMLEWHDVLLLRPIADPAATTERPLSLLVAEVEGLTQPAWFESETAKNDYPSLPVREGERVLLFMTPPGAAPPAELARLETQRLRLAPAPGPRSRDFDFFMGRWKVHHRRRRNPLTGSNSWYESDGTAAARPVWGGLANTDEIDYQGPNGNRMRGMTVRLYDPKTRLWSLYWANNTMGCIGPPVVGSFAGGRGEFYGHEIFDGKGVFVRYVWSEITATSCRWEQAFSDDGGRGWESNWTMDFTRID